MNEPSKAMSKPLAPLPPLGWNSWNLFGPSVDEAKIRAAARAMVDSGLKALGYRYLVIDDGWSEPERDGNGDLVPHRERFPNGIKALAEHVHGLGLKLGIYSDAAEKTCGGYLGSLGFEEQDAARWASWGVDYLKYDYCNAPGDQATAIERYGRMGRALEASGRDIVFSLCEWGGRHPHLWGREAGGHLWRCSGDVFDSWIDLWVDQPGYWGLGIDQGFDRADRLAPYSGPNAWNDLDMLVVGLRGKGQIKGGGLSDLEYQTHFGLWALACSPLMAGCDLSAMDAATAGLLLNPEVLALNQDPLGRAARRVRRWGDCEAWTKPLADGSLALGLFNRGSQGAEIAVESGELGLLDAPKLLRDLWARSDVGELADRHAQRLLPHQCVLYKVSPR